MRKFDLEDGIQGNVLDMKVSKRSVDEAVVEYVVEEKRPKMVEGFDRDLAVDGVGSPEHPRVIEEPMDVGSNGHKPTPTRCPICLWPANSPQCYHSN